MTEQDVLNVYQSHLVKLIRKYSPSVPFEDALSDVQIVLLLAVRSYRPAYHGAFWADFACSQVIMRLKELQKEKNTLYRRERLPLDAAISDESKTTFAQFLLIEPPKINQIELWELLSRAPEIAQKVGWRIIDKSSQAEIQQDLHLSAQEYQNCLYALQTVWETYNQESPY